jgi:hypothetical protein
MFLLLGFHIEQSYETRPDQKVGCTNDYTFEVILPTGKPKLPKKVANIFKKQCGVLVRDHVPISIQEWNKHKGAGDSEYVTERYKESLWNDLMADTSQTYL